MVRNSRRMIKPKKKKFVYKIQKNQAAFTDRFNKIDFKIHKYKDRKGKKHEYLVAVKDKKRISWTRYSTNKEKYQHNISNMLKRIKDRKGLSAVYKDIRVVFGVRPNNSLQKTKGLVRSEIHSDDKQTKKLKPKFIQARGLYQTEVNGTPKRAFGYGRIVKYDGEKSMVEARLSAMAKFIDDQVPGGVRYDKNNKYLNVKQKLVDGDVQEQDYWFVTYY